MKRSYLITKVESRDSSWIEEVLAAAVDCFPWGGAGGRSDFRPLTTARMAVSPDEDALLVYMESDEWNPRSMERGYSGQVYTDSCMELFLMPDPERSNLYFNWEFNPSGAMYLTLGTHRYDRRDIVPAHYEELFQVHADQGDNGWFVEYRIPLDFLREYFPLLQLASGSRMLGNFYKCGDKTPDPHFGCWSPIDLPEPDFHCPGFFGEFTIRL